VRESRKLGYRRCYLCAAKTKHEFRSWRIVENEYPYDRISATHHMVTLKRHSTEADLTTYEKMEFERDVKPYLHKHYDMLFENTVRTKSIPGHHHIHMINLKQQTKQHPPRTAHNETVLPLGALPR
jgi:hypothetical protein